MTDAPHIARLIYQMLEGSASEAEALELSAWRAENPEHEKFFARVMAEEGLASMIRDQHPENRDALRQEIWERMEGRISFNAVTVKLNSGSRKWKWWKIAAVVIPVMFGIYFLMKRTENGEQSTENRVQRIEDRDIQAPELNRAMVTLSDGRTVYLDSAGNGDLALQGNIRLVKLSNGQIAYQTMDGQLLTDIKYNTLTNPRGSRVIDMALSDGSHIWLNAGSSVTYPVAFVGNERRVSITGEAYFEVAHNRSKPFFVSRGDLQVEVLGTKFNVNAFDDEEDIKVTLLEGSVKVKDNKSSILVRPGQQAISGENEALKLNINVDLEQVMAWKNGLFHFSRADLPTVLRELARWFDVEVEYRGVIPKREFGGEIQRTLSLNEVLKILEKNNVHFRIEGRKLIVEK